MITMIMMMMIIIRGSREKLAAAEEVSTVFGPPGLLLYGVREVAARLDPGAGYEFLHYY